MLLLLLLLNTMLWHLRCISGLHTPHPCVRLHLCLQTLKEVIENPDQLVM
jgi:hypothetical protein